MKVRELWRTGNVSLYFDQLLSANDDTYAYDSRGNITSKTESGTTTTFTYSNSGWKDQLISVNGVDLTYDDNGNVLTYGNKEYTWNSGRNLESIVGGDNEYHYTYDENGIRTSKEVGSVTTYFNTKDGVILSQTDGTNTWYFQYDTNGSPLGFVLNGTQYFYITNQMGDVLAITDTNGDIVADYEYDAWGGVTLADTDIAKQSPLRYRGYYYDNETGYYYLQSRYYDSNICRFINADIPEISQMSKNISVGDNLFAYCCNDSVNNSDPNGFWVIKRTRLETLLDIIIAMCASEIAAPMDIAGKVIKKKFGKSKTYKAVSRVGNHLILDGLRCLWIC